MSILIDKMVMVRAPTGVLQVPSAVRLEGPCAVVPGTHYRDTLCTHANATNISTNKACLFTKTCQNFFLQQCLKA